MSEWFPTKSADYDDLAPTAAEARADEAAVRRRRPIPRDTDDGPSQLLAALERATATVQHEYRKRSAG